MGWRDEWHSGGTSGGPCDFGHIWAGPKPAVGQACFCGGATWRAPHEPKADLKPPAPTYLSEKPPMHALPLEKLSGLARVLDYGDGKYAPRNWLGSAVDPRLYQGALLRHLAAIDRGEMLDPESGLPHVWHVQACALILDEALRNSKAYEWSPP